MRYLFILIIVVLAVCGCKKTETTPLYASTGVLTDVDGNTYKTVVIGGKTWMSENLKTTKYSDGSAIQLVTDSKIWNSLKTAAYCWYNNDITNKNIYGALYNWNTVETGKLCPSGWRVPNDSEWLSLTILYGGQYAAGGKLKESGNTHWETPNTGATNESGFNALPGGFRVNDNRIFDGIKQTGCWWTSSGGGDYALSQYLNYDGASSNVFDGLSVNGESVRCIKD